MKAVGSDKQRVVSDEDCKGLDPKVSYGLVLGKAGQGYVRLIQINLYAGPISGVSLNVTYLSRLLYRIIF